MRRGNHRKITPQHFAPHTREYLKKWAIY